MTAAPGATLSGAVRAALPPGDAVASRFDRLVDIVAGLESCVLALSGGVDSALLLRVAAELLGARCLAVTGDSAALPAWDRDDATSAAATAAALYGARSRSIATKEVDDPRYAENPRSRCYFCKAEVYGALTAIAAAEGLRWVVDGTNATDLAAPDRPGTAAAESLGVRSPLAEAGLTKDDVRAVARALGMAAWDRPASACLSSRIPFGARITPERLRRVESAELGVRALGFRQVRVRDLGGRARVEVEPDEVARAHANGAAIDAAIRGAGFSGWSVAAYAGTGAGDVRDIAT